MSVALILLVASSVRAHAALHAVVQASATGQNADAYMVLTNLAQAGNRLVEISCDCAERVEVHEMVGEGTERSMVVRPAVEMPPTALVEIPPGSARHLMLIGLRRPLVAGDWIELRFRFEQGSSTERFRVVADPRAAWSAAIAQQQNAVMQPFAFVAGSCWRGTFPDGRRTDTHCFSPIYSGSYMMDRHVVEGAPTPYSGETLFRRDVMARRVGFTYRSSDGSVTQGQAIPIEGGLSFPEEHRDADGTVSPIRTTWLRDGADAYLVRSEIQRGGAWRTMLNMRMERVGPSSGAP